MYNFLRHTELKIQGVCFAVQAGENRATSEFKYVVAMTLDFFSKDVLENLYGMCTHASTKKPSASKFLVAEKIDQIHCFDNQSVFPSEMDREPESASDESMNGEDDSDQNKVLYNLAMSQYSKFFKKSMKKEPVSMIDTRQVLSYKDMLRQLVRDANINVNLIIEEMVSLKNCIESLKQNCQKFFDDPGSLMVSVSKRLVEEFNSPSGMVTQCNMPDCCEKSCHEECYVSDKNDCTMITNGICRGCNHSV